MKTIQAQDLLFILSLLSICKSHILIDPLFLLDASAGLSSFLLSAELQSVKDVADSVFSQENIDAISTIAAQTADFAKNSINTAQSSIDIQSITNSITNSAPATTIGSAVEGFLSSNPDLKLSANEYASNIASSIASRLAQNSDDFLTAYPELTKSTSAYTSDLISDFYTNTVTPKLNDVLATLDTSPLATSTRQAISESPKTVEKVLNFYNTKVAQIAEIKAKVTDISKAPVFSGFTEFSSASKSVVGDKINSNFDAVLNNYPQLKQSTSEFTVATLNNEVIPKLEQTRDFLYNSPLGKDTREFAARSTSDVVASISSDVSIRLSPYTSVLGDVTNRLLTRATSPFADFFTGINSAVLASTADTLTAIPKDFNLATIPIPTVNLDITSLLEGQKDTLLSTGNSVVESIVPTAQTVFSALEKANNRLFSEFAQAGTTLGNNIISLGIVTGDVTVKILNSAASSGGAVIGSIEGSARETPAKLTELASLAPSALLDLQAAVATSTADITGRTVASVAGTVDSSLSAVSGWKLFSDDKHWENGFWEQKIIALQKLQLGDFSNDKLDEINQNVLSTLDAAGRRFSDQYESSRSKSFDTLGLKDNFNFAQVKNYDVYAKNYETFQSNLRTAADAAVEVTNTIVKTSGVAVDGLNKLKDSGVKLLTEELQSNNYI